MTLDELAAMEKARDKCPWARQTGERNAFLRGFEAGIAHERATPADQLPPTKNDPPPMPKVKPARFSCATCEDVPTWPNNPCVSCKRLDYQAIATPADHSVPVAITLEQISNLEEAVCEGRTGAAGKILHHMRNALACPEAYRGTTPATLQIVLQTKRGYNGGFAQRAEPMGRVILRTVEGREMEMHSWNAVKWSRGSVSILKEFFKCEVVEESVTDDRAR